MRVLLYHHDNRGEQEIVEALAKGLKRHGEHVEVLSKRLFDKSQIRAWDVVFTGRLASSDYVMDACAEMGVHYVYFDKGYFFRGWKTDDPDIYYRFSIDAFQPLKYFQAVSHPPERWQKLEIKLHDRRQNGSRIIFAGCSPKFGVLFGFNNTEFAVETFRRIREFTDRPIVYRPKPSDNSAVPIEGTVFSQGDRKIEDELKDAYAVVTFSSNVALDAIIAGVPAFVLGPAIARPVSNTDLSRLNDPYFPSEEDRFQWCCDLAYCQWRFDEIENGTLWNHLKKVILEVIPRRGIRPAPSHYSRSVFIKNGAVLKKDRFKKLKF